MKAILVVDVQKGLVDKALFKKENFLNEVKNAIKEFRQHSQLVVFIQHNNNQLVEYSESWKIFKELDVRKEDPIVQKQHGNSFEKTNLKKILKEKGVTEILVGGLVSHGCVRATCLGGLEEGYKVTLLNEGHTCWNQDAKEKIRKVEEELKEKGIQVRSSKEVLEEDT